MSVIAFTGLPGSGKTYCAVERTILSNLPARRIITNIQLQNLPPEYSKNYVFLDDLPSLDNDFWSKPEPGAIYVFDELQLILPSGLKANNIPDPVKNFFTRHRHYSDENGVSIEIVIITQDLSNIANFVRQLVEFTYRTKKLNAIGRAKNYKLEIFTGPVTGAKPPKSSLVNSYILAYKSETFKHYKTHSESSAVSVNEKSAESISVFDAPIVKYGLGAALLLIAFGLYGGYKFFTDGTAPANASPSAHASDFRPPPEIRDDLPVARSGSGAEESAQTTKPPIITSSPVVLESFACLGDHCVARFSDGSKRKISASYLRSICPSCVLR